LEPLLLKATEAGKLLGLGRSKIFAMMAAGEFPVIRIGRSIRIPREALEQWVRDQTTEAEQLKRRFQTMDEPFPL
jgi:excisionase family DNA binding protein